MSSNEEEEFEREFTCPFSGNIMNEPFICEKCLNLIDGSQKNTSKCPYCRQKTTFQKVHPVLKKTFDRSKKKW